MSKMLRKVLIASSIALSAASMQESHAQVTITPNLTAQQMAQSLVGQGVIMLNPQLNCANNASGYFDFMGNPSAIGIDSGIVLTSGSTINTGAGFATSSGIANPSSATASFNNSYPGDALLSALAGQTTHDACILEFDFIPSGDTIKFDYVFGSDEYPTYNCSINDVFGFFITGNGFPTPTNIALVPGTTNVMVGISTVNNGVNPYGPCLTNTYGHGPYSQYYNNGNQYIVYNGFTDVFTAVASVIPCDTYHLKLAIADASDGILDSGVFLKAGSLNSVGVSLSAATTEGANAPAVPHCVRGCKPGKINFTRPSALAQPLTIHYLIEGTAINGVDYEHIADSIVIPAGQTNAVLEIKPLLASAATGPRTVIIKALSPYLCGTTGALNILDSSMVTIYDSLFAHIPTPPTTVCPGDVVTIQAEVDPTLLYSWSPSALIPDAQPTLTINPTPYTTTTYTFMATMIGTSSSCRVVRQYTATVEPIPMISMPADITACLSDSIDINVFVEPEGPNYNYLWTPATHLRDNFSGNNKFYANPGDYQLNVKVSTPVANCSSNASMMIHVKPPMNFDEVSPIDTTINYGDEITLNTESVAVEWYWDPRKYLNDPYAKSPLARPLEDMIYTVIGTDIYGCKDTAELKIKVNYESIGDLPNAFTPNGDGLNDVFNLQNIKYEKLVAFKIFNRYGQEVFQTTDAKKGWDGTIKGKPAPAGVYYYHVKLAFPFGEIKEIKGDVTLIR